MALCLALAVSASPAPALDQCEVALDVDGDGEVEALTDGLLILRYLFGFTGSTLVAGAVDLANCTRCTATAIEVYLEGLGGGTMGDPLAVWEATTVPFDPDCPGCALVETSDTLPHLGVEVEFLYDAAVDDPLAQWGDCLQSMLECLEGAGGVSACAAAAACPTECKALYASRAPGGADELTLLEVLNGVYVDCGAPCRPLEEVAP